MPTREFAELQDAFDLMLRRFNDTRSALDGQMGEERRMREELQSLQRQVIRQERLAAVGQLVSGVAHEINNPLQAILGFAELLQMQADVSDSVKTDLRLIQKESARACNIIRNLAMFARQQPGEAAPVRLTDVITSVAELRQRRLESEQIELRVEDRSTQYVSAVLTELQQVLLNFVVNAEQAILASGRLPGRITIRSGDLDGRVTLEVEDTGPGIACRQRSQAVPARSSRPSRSGRAPASGCRSATASSTRSAVASATAARPPAARSSTSTCPRRPSKRRDFQDLLHRPVLPALRGRRDQGVSSTRAGRRRCSIARAFYPTSGGQPFDMRTARCGAG